MYERDADLIGRTKVLTAFKSIYLSLFCKSLWLLCVPSAFRTENRLSVFSTQNIGGVNTTFTLKSDYFPKQHLPFPR
jgi:hypothetical protein